ncbi:MAG: class I SAM-dependent methyltransferase, partial [Magnetococcales bacterium]|nr:class I SAM-dependent methyltransferase [Magnetococcales bacterium]
MISQLRYYVGLCLPVSLKWRLVRVLPELVNLLALFVQGMRRVWDEDESFSEAYKVVASRSLSDKRRAYVLYSVAKNIVTSGAVIAELGVYRGATSYLMDRATNGRHQFHLFDTFEGLPETDPNYDPFWKSGDMNEPEFEEVKRFLPDERFHFYKGIFPETAKALPEDLTFSLVHVDMDIYQSTVDALQLFYPRMVPGGIIVIDDYGLLTCGGLKMALDQFRAVINPLQSGYDALQATLIQQRTHLEVVRKEALKPLLLELLELRDRMAAGEKVASRRESSVFSRFCQKEK